MFVQQSLQRLCKFESIAAKNIAIINIHDVCAYRPTTGSVAVSQLVAATVSVTILRCIHYVSSTQSIESCLPRPSLATPYNVVTYTAIPVEDV